MGFYSTVRLRYNRGTNSPLVQWFESMVVIAIALLAFAFGRWCSRLPKHYWLIGYFLPLGFVLMAVLVADPASGLRVGLTDEFGRQGHFVGIPVKRACGPLW